MRLREAAERDEERRLARWACFASRSGGRVHAEEPHAYRTAFQRDRDRILRSTAFRRLQYKTQVFVYHEGDHFRNRLTHTLEVAQIARTVARTLGANEDLTEAIVLAHDLGHTPFGHSGQDALNRLMAEDGGFEHNRQSLRIVDLLEIRTPAYRGLNLCEKTRAGLLKHGVQFPADAHPVPLPQIRTCPVLEAQIADTSDAIAYNNHDVDDGLRSGLLDWESLRGVELWARAQKRWDVPAGEDRRALRPRIISAMIDLLVSNLIDETATRLDRAGVRTVDDVQDAAEPMVGFSPEIADCVRELGDMLQQRVYRHQRVVRMAAKAERILRDLWVAYNEDPRQLPPRVVDRLENAARPRIIADYLAGMTDRFAMEEHRKLFDPHARV